MEIEETLRLPESSARTAWIVAWIQSLYAEAERPVLVGGAAVELITGGAYTTGDIDLVGSTPPVVARALEAAGFSRVGRHWINEEHQVFIEFPGSALGPGERTRELMIDGTRVLIIGTEDLLVDRLGAWEYWKSSVDALNAYLIWRKVGDAIDRNLLRERAEAAGFSKALRSLLAFVEKRGERTASEEELERWAMQGP